MKFVKKKKKLSVDELWERGIPHDPRSVEIYNRIEKLDFENGDCFDFKSGGDGDNGEQLMYLLDIFFKEKDESGS